MAAAIVSALGFTGAAAAIATAVINFAISYIAQSLFGPEEPEEPADLGVSARIPTDPRNKLPVIYGEYRVAGQTVMADIRSDNQVMAFIIALSEGDCEAIDEITWEDKVLSFGGLDLSTGLRSVTNATDDDGETYSFLNDGRFKVQVFPTGGPCVPMQNFSDRWLVNADKRTFPNTAYAYCELTYDREERVTGLPSRLYFNVKGRTVDTLNSDGTFTTQTTATSNPVDCFIDYLTNKRYGCSIPVNAINLDTFYKHKVFCDVNIDHTQSSCVLPSNSFTTQNGATAVVSSDYPNEVSCAQAAFFVGASAGSRTATTGGTWTQATTTITDAARYTTNGSVNTNAELDRNLSDLTIGNGGILTYNLGQFGLISQGARTQAQRGGNNIIFSEDNIIGKLDITGAGFDSVLNEITARFTSIQQKYQQEQIVVSIAEGSPIRNANEPRLEKTIRLPMTNNNVEAERAIAIVLNESRQSLVVKFATDIQNMDLQAGDIIGITHATPDFNNKLFRIQQIDEKVIDSGDNSIGVSIIAREYSVTVYADRTINLTDLAPNTNLPDPFIIPALTVTTADVSEVINGVPTSQINVDWSTTTSFTYVDTVEVRYFSGSTDPTNDDDWNVVTSLGENIILSNLEPETNYRIQTRVRNTLGSIGSFSASVNQATVALDSIAPLVIRIDSDNGGTVYVNSAGTKDLTTTVNISGIDRPDTTTGGVNGHNTFSYRWSQDGAVICLDGNTNDVVGTATVSVQSSQLACVSAGGTWVPGNSVGTQCQSNGSIFDSQSDSVLGCTVASSNRADTDITGSTISSLRTITIEADDITNSAGITCTVDNIT